MSEDALGNAGYAITGSGGGGSGGKYVFASLEELDSIKSQWTAILEAILVDGARLSMARDALHAPADDLMSNAQYTAITKSLNSAIKHNKRMHDYADDYVRKLEAAAEGYVSDDEVNAAQFRSANDD